MDTVETMTEPTDWMSYQSAHHTGDEINGSGVSFYGTTQDGHEAARTYDGREYIKFDGDGQWHELVKCAYCGKKGPHRIHSGVYECGACWDWRKLDSGAARYWYILSMMVGSSIDLNDLTRFFPKSLGWSEEDIKTFTRLIKEMFEKTEALAKEHHRDEYWKEQAQGLFNQLEGGLWPDPNKKADSE